MRSRKKIQATVNTHPLAPGGRHTPRLLTHSQPAVVPLACSMRKREAKPLSALGASSRSSASTACVGSTALRRCLLCLGFIYFQVSTFTLVQWVREHSTTLHSHISTQSDDANVPRHAAFTSAPAAAPDAHGRSDSDLSPPLPVWSPLSPPPPLPQPLPLSSHATTKATLPSSRKQHSGQPRQQRQPRQHDGSKREAPPQQQTTTTTTPQLLPNLGGGDDAIVDDEADESATVATHTNNNVGIDDTSVREQLGEGLLNDDARMTAGAQGGGGGDGGDGGGGGGGSSVKLAEWKDSALYGKFIGITTFFNPGRHQNKVDNFRKFRQGVAAQGLQLLCVELVFGKQTPFQLKGPNDADAGGGGEAGDDKDDEGEDGKAAKLLDEEDGADGGAEPNADDAGGAAPPPSASPPLPPDCDILIHKRTLSENTLWQKERLLNIALENLPPTVDKVMWLDSDLIFLNDDWVPETAELLDRYPVVQPFAWMTYLQSGQERESAIEELPTLPLGQGVGDIYHSAGLGLQSFPDMCFRSNFMLGHPGFAWAARRDVITRSGFYDRSIIGGGDRIMLNAFTGHYAGVSRKMPPAMVDDLKAFGRKVTPYVGPTNISYTQGVVLHIWHGNRADRDYIHRYQILLLNKYDPVHDVQVNEDGIMVWSSHKPKMHQQVTEYFSNRKEGPKPNKTSTPKGEGDDAWTAQRKSLSRPVRSFLGYHCGKTEYRPACKVAFQLWGDALRAQQLQLLNKKMAEQRKAAEAAMVKSRAEAAQRGTSNKKKWKGKKKKKQPAREDD